jgi:hypothetical protein
MAYAGVPHDIGEGAARVTVHHELYVYDDEAAARLVFHELQADLASCLGFPQPRVPVNERPGWGDEAVAVTIAWPADGAGEHAGEPLRMVAHRVGKALAGVLRRPRPGRGRRARACRRAQTLPLRPRLRAKGCPASTADYLHDGGSAWVAVLYISSQKDAAPLAAALPALQVRTLPIRTQCL